MNTRVLGILGLVVVASCTILIFKMMGDETGPTLDAGKTNGQSVPGPRTRRSSNPVASGANDTDVGTSAPEPRADQPPDLGEMTGHTLARDTREFLENITVEAQASGWTGSKATSGSDGSFQLNIPTDRETTLLATGKGWATTRIVVSKPVKGQQIQMVPGGTIRGRTVGENGEPIAGAKVFLEFPYEPNNIRTSKGTRQYMEVGPPGTVSSEDGTFELVGVPANLRCRIIAEHDKAEGHSRLFGTGQDLPDEEIRIVLRAFATFAGTVTWEDGKPGGHMKIRLEKESWRHAPMEQHTDTEGAFSFARVPAGRYRIHIQGGETPPYDLDKNIDLAPGMVMTGHAIVLTRGFSLSGTLVAEGAAKGRSADVSLSAWGRTFNVTTRTDAGGRFRFEHLPLEMLEIRLNTKDLRLVEEARIPAGQEDIVLKATAATARVTGRVVVGENGRVPVFRVLLKDGHLDTLVENRVDTSGQEGQYLTPLMPPGDYLLRVQATGAASGVAKISLAANQTLTQDFQLRRMEETMTGTVTDAKGNPLDGALVSLFEPKLEPSTNNAIGTMRRAFWTQFMSKATTDTEGRFELPLQIDQGVITVIREGYASTWTGYDAGATRDVLLVLSKGVSVTGRLFSEDHQPEPGVEVRLAQTGLSFSDTTLKARSDEVGHFVFPHVAPGNWTIHVLPSGFHSGWRKDFKLRTQNVDLGDINP